MLQAQPNDSVPEETARIAHQIFPKGNRYLNLRDELGSIWGFLHYPSKRYSPL